MADRIDQPQDQPSPAAQAAQITGFRIMRQTEITPGWWGQPSEVGETGSSIVADRFCTTQNTVTMDANRDKRILFFADPIYGDNSEPTARMNESRPTPGDVYTSAAAKAHDAHCPPCRDVTTRLATLDTALAVSTARVDRYTLGLRNTRPAVTA